MTKATPSIIKSKSKEKIVGEDIHEVESPVVRVTRSSFRKLQIQKEKIVQEEKK